ncbi:MAG: MarR family transcriptional regulator [Candidatus Hodarchaeota archaeon]
MEEKVFPEILKLEEELTNFFEDLFYARGGSPLLGRIYALCVLSAPNKPLFQKDLVSRFEVNPSTISRNLKELENWRLIDRRREPGSREWKYQVEPASFLELIVNRFEDNITMLRDSGGDLQRIRRHWGEALSDDSKNSDKGKRVLQVLEILIKWISIVEIELDKFIQTLHKRFQEMEQPIE